MVQIEINKNEFMEFPILNLCFNWIILLLINTIFGALLINYMNFKEIIINSGTYNHLFYLLFIFIFGIFFLKSSYGNFTPVYDRLGKHWYNPILGEIHGILLLINILLIILSNGRLIIPSIIFFANLFFIFNIIITIIYSFIPYKEVKK